MSPTKIQPREYSKGSATDDILYFSDGSSWVNPNGNRNVPYLNRDGSKRKLNLNWFDNDWNDICRFLAVRQFNHSPSHCWGSFVIKEFWELDYL